MFLNFFRRNKKRDEDIYELPIPENASFSFIGTDIHSHLVPGIDDGAKTVEDSVAMIKKLVSMGYRQIVTTPHVMIDMYRNTPETINNGLEILKDALQKEGINIPIKAAAEYYIDEYFFSLIGKEPLLTVTKNEVLVEFSMLYEPPMLDTTIFNMQTLGYKPILAHPERYNSLHQNFERYQQLKDKGCLFQLNLLSLHGYYGRNVAEVAHKLLRRGMYDYCGTDMHHERHADTIQSMLKTSAFLTLSGYPFRNNTLTF